MVRSPPKAGVSNHEATSAPTSKVSAAADNEKLAAAILRDALLRNAPQDEV